MTWAIFILAAGMAYVAWSHDRHINRLYRQVAELERKLRDVGRAPE